MFIATLRRTASYPFPAARLRSAHIQLHPQSNSLPSFGFAGNWAKSGTAKMATVGTTVTDSLTMAPQKPLSDVTETTSIVSTVYGTSLFLTISRAQEMSRALLPKVLS